MHQKAINMEPAITNLQPEEQKTNSSRQGQTICLMSIQDNKAGMKGLDKEKINQLLEKMSKDTLHYKHEQERDLKMDEQIKKMKKDWNTYTNAAKKNAMEMMEKARENLSYEKQARDLSQIIVHIDMDMFFAAVEMRDDPSLCDKPMAVGSLRMISTSNYIARRFGVRSGMAGFICMKLCPDLVIVPCNMRKYSQVSGIIMNILRRYDQDLFVMSCDEAYLNITNYVTQLFLKENPDWDSPVLVADQLAGERRLIPECWDLAFKVVDDIRTQVLEATKLTASAGIATTSMLAKICSDLNKPNGQYMLRGSSFEHVQDFVDKLDVRKVNGIGKVQEKFLKAFNINTVHDIWERRDVIQLLFKPAAIDFYLRVSLGLGSSFTRDEEEKLRSKGRGSSFKATNDFNWLDSRLSQLCGKLAESLNDHGLKGKMIVLRLEKDTFDAYVKSRRLSFYTSDFSVIHQTAKSILKAQLSASSDSKWRAMRVMVTHLNVNKITPIDDKKQMTLDKFFKKSVLQNNDTLNESLDECLQKIEHCNGSQNVPEKQKFSVKCCSKTFSDYVAFEKHETSCLEEDQLSLSSIETIEVESDLESDEYLCTNCDEKFLNYNGLEQHLAICLEAVFCDAVIQTASTEIRVNYNEHDSSKNLVIIPNNGCRKFSDGDVESETSQRNRKIMKLC